MAAGEAEGGLSGIRGWLILVAIGLCLTPVRLGADIVKGLRAFDPGVWHAVTTPGTAAYHPLFGPLIVGELVTNAALLIWSVVLLYLFFAKRRAFPSSMIAFLIVRLAVEGADLVVARMIPSAAAAITPAIYGALGGGVLVVLIWVPYFLRSRRVHATFVG